LNGTQHNCTKAICVRSKHHKPATKEPNLSTTTEAFASSACWKRFVAAQNFLKHSFKHGQISPQAEENCKLPLLIAEGRLKKAMNETVLDQSAWAETNRAIAQS